ncbi:phage virion morphogenesis protein [Shewanella algae]|uniref:phage virion morphogenesis protein n=1 Tax=Shewanella algae TaxID=38313 RepID=UPI001AAD4331|nr:phage virion morphogenesis protein [Shewanella algae]MBO2611221.1 phage virion morphogenesis protein [Shewanella algae]MBO2695532.1 phage virion morphogenesis protein [Shewanella algae]
MVGARIEVTLDGDTGVIQQLQRLVTKGEQLGPLMNDIGEMLLFSHNQRNAEGIAPDGTPWAPLSTATQALKPHHKNSPLRLNDILLQQLLYQADENGLELGSNMVYAAMQHFGGTTSPKSMIPGKEIPAREFIGLSSDDEQAVLDMVVEYLEV